MFNLDYLAAKKLLRSLGYENFVAEVLLMAAEIADEIIADDGVLELRCSGRVITFMPPRVIHPITSFEGLSFRIPSREACRRIVEVLAPDRIALYKEAVRDAV